MFLSLILHCWASRAADIVLLQPSALEERSTAVFMEVWPYCDVPLCNAERWVNIAVLIVQMDAELLIWQATKQHTCASVNSASPVAPASPVCPCLPLAPMCESLALAFICSTVITPCISLTLLSLTLISRLILCLGIQLPSRLFAWSTLSPLFVILIHPEFKHA